MQCCFLKRYLPASSLLVQIGLHATILEYLVNFLPENLPENRNDSVVATDVPIRRLWQFSDAGRLRFVGLRRRQILTGSGTLPLGGQVGQAFRIGRDFDPTAPEMAIVSRRGFRKKIGGLPAFRRRRSSARLWEQLREYFDVRFRAEKYGVPYYLAESEATHGKSPK
jgi:hypothetical protein